MLVLCYELWTCTSYIEAAQGARTGCNDDVCYDRLAHAVVVVVDVVKIAVIVVMLCRLLKPDKWFQYSYSFMNSLKSYEILRSEIESTRRCRLTPLKSNFERNEVVNDRWSGLVVAKRVRPTTQWIANSEPNNNNNNNNTYTPLFRFFFFYFRCWCNIIIKFSIYASSLLTTKLSYHACCCVWRSGHLPQSSIYMHVSMYVCWWLCYLVFGSNVTGVASNGV